MTRARLLIRPGERARRAIALAWLIAVVPSALLAQVSNPTSGVPAGLLGEFVDDYGIRYVVTEQEWRQGTETRFAIVEWNVEERYLIARNAPENPSEAGLWTRIDWVRLDPGSDYEWAFCYAAYDAESRDAARSAPASTRAQPREGCNGFPFSRMRRPGYGAMASGRAWRGS